MTLNFPTHVNKEIENLSTRAQGETKLPYIAKKKHYILSKAMENWNKLKPKPANEFSGLSKPSNYILSLTQEPEYFSKEFKENVIPATEHASAFYDYKPDGANVTYWVDFANVDLGGGVFDNGFVQEEVMCCETPDLANAAAIGHPTGSEIQTRAPAKDGVLEGSPRPVVIMDVNRVLNIDTTGIYGKDFAPAQVQQVKDAIDKAELKAAQTYNVLAAAAPKLPSTDPNYQKALNTLKDLFNTFVAAFTLALDHAGGKNLTINTGKIGAGAFHNNIDVVYVLQRLAAEQVSSKIKLKFWAYSDAEVTGASSQFTEIVKAFNTQKATKNTVKDLLDAAWVYWGSHH